MFVDGDDLSGFAGGLAGSGGAVVDDGVYEHCP
jgi:hypothetical protein